MALWTRKVDPATGGYVVEDGRYVRIDAALGNAHALIATDAGSAPDAPQFSCRLREVAPSVYPGMTRAVESTIGQSLERYDGTTWDAHTVRAWINEIGRLEYEATVDGEVV
uniref:Uncharacterized protein n=1 Tax=viral metagenome TaxID=1070528 RepID=A0A6H1ZJ67_9ZZZZ